MVLNAELTLLALGFLVTGIGELVVLKAAHAWQLYAHPNERSSHVQPTPGIGGIAVVVPMLALLGYLAFVGYGSLAGLALGALLVALVSLWDDLRDLSAAVRLPVHLLAVALALSVLPAGVDLWMLAIAWVAVAWHLNLFNFMDGIDGYAGSQCLLFAMGALLLMQGGAGWTGALLSLLAGSSIGFLIYNWPPARIFMGDVGSSSLGLVLGIVVVHMAAVGQLPLIASLLLLAGFWFDASYTLCVRIVTGQPFTQAHRSHLYQRLTDERGHRWVTQLFWVHGVCWLLPLAWLSNQYAQYAVPLLVLGLLPLLYGCWRWQAGKILEQPTVP